MLHQVAENEKGKQRGSEGREEVQARAAEKDSANIPSSSVLQSSERSVSVPLSPKFHEKISKFQPSIIYHSPQCSGKNSISPQKNEEDATSREQVQLKKLILYHNKLNNTLKLLSTQTDNSFSQQMSFEIQKITQQKAKQQMKFAKGTASGAQSEFANCTTH